MKRIAAVAVLAACMSVSLVAVATAHTVKRDSTVIFQIKKNGPADDTYEGKVLSDSNRCVAGRQVVIYQRVAGPDVVVDDAITDANGDYSSTAGDIPAGTYYAVVTRKVLRNDADHTHVCKRDVSPERVVAG